MMLYIIFQYGLELVLIQWILISGKAILEKLLSAHLPRKFIVEWGDEKMECPANDDIIVEGDKEGYKHCTEP